VSGRSAANSASWERSSGDQVLPSVSLTTTGGVLAFFNQGVGIDGAVLGGSYHGSGPSAAVNKTAIATNDQVRPSVRELRNGNTVFVWQSKLLGASHIFARFAKGTNFYTPDIRVNASMK
jgi:hypothetical protein